MPIGGLVVGDRPGLAVLPVNIPRPVGVSARRLRRQGRGRSTAGTKVAIRARIIAFPT